MRTRNATPHITTRLNPLFLVGVFIILAAVVAVPVYSGSSSSTPAGSSSATKVTSRAPAKVSQVGSLPVSDSSALTPWATMFGPLVPVPQSSPEAIYTYAQNCTTSQTDFNLGDAMCAKANGVPVTLFPWRVLWLDPAGNVRQSNTAIADDQAMYQFTLPGTPTSIVNGQTVDNRGTWRVNLVSSNGARRQTAPFTVHEPANPVADVYVQKFNRDPDQQVTAGGSVAFIVLVGNDGPDPATSVHLVDSAPIGSTLASFSQQVGPNCLPNGTGDCTMATLNNGDRAEFTVVYNTGSSAPGTYSTSASVSSATTDSDTSDNSSTAEFEIGAGGGGSQCTLTCPTSPAAVNNEPGQNGATVDWDGPNNDNVPVATGGSCGAVSVSTTSPHFFSIGSTPVTVTTESGEECTFSVTVLDVENPDIGNCPANITVTEDAGTPGEAIVNYPTPSATDNSGIVTVDCSAPSGSSFTVAGSPHTVTCTATDSSGNTDSCTFNVTVTAGTTECTLTPPANITVTSDANQCGTVVTYQDPTQSGTCGTVTCDRASGSVFPVGTTVVSCRDTSGASTSFTVTVNDETPPVPDLTPLPNITKDCTAIAGVPTPTVIQTPTGPQTIIVMEPPTATDNCGGQIAGATEDPRTYQDPGTFIVHWTYTDAAGNTTTQNQTITVTGTDTTAPVPDVANPTVTGECSVTVTPLTATDDCDGTITGTTPDPLTYTGVGTYTVHWTYTDLAGHSVNQNQTVIVTDVTNPTIALVGASSITVECHTSFDDPGVTTTDNCLPKNVTVATTGAFDINTPNTYTLTYTATDGGGNQASVQRTVIVEDTIKPVITLNAPTSVPPVECHTSFTDPGATASDTCDTSVPVTVSGMVDVNTPGTYVLTYNASDDSGNQADSVQRTVTVVDTTAPTITLNSYAPSMWPPNHKYQTFGLTQFVTGATDSCDTTLGISGVVIEKVTSDEIENGNGDGNTLNDIVIAADCKSVQLRSEREGSSNGRVYTIFFKVTDASGNVGTATAKVVVRHNPGETAVDSGVHYTVTCGGP